MNMDKRYGGYRIGKVPEDAKRRERSRQKTPPRVDLRKFLTSVESQVGNSCVANAMAGAYEYLAKRELGDSEDMINEEPDEDSYTRAPTSRSSRPSTSKPTRTCGNRPWRLAT